MNILKAIGENWWYAYESYRFACGDKESAFSVEGMKLHGLPSDLEEREHAAATFAVMAVISKVTGSPTIEAKVDDFATAVEMYHIAMSMQKFAQYGFVTITDKQDEYGWPVYEIDEQQIRELRATFDRK